MVETSKALPGVLPLRQQGPIFLISLGHGATHWLLGTFFILLPFITRDFGLSYTQAGVLVSVLQITSFFTNVLGGMVVDMSGKRIGFLIGCLIIGGGAMIGFGFVSIYLLMVPLVALIAFSISFWHSPAISWISRQFPSNRGYAISIHSTGASLGDMIAPGVAGLLLTVMSWNDTAMTAALPPLVLAGVIFMVLMPGEKSTLAAERKGITLSAYLEGMRQMFRQLGMLGMCLMVAFRGMAQSGLTMFLPLYLANVLKVSPGLVGGTILAMHLGAVVMSPVAGVASDRLGRRPVVMAGLVATTIIILGLTLASNTAIFVGGVSLLGFSLYSIRAVMQSWMVDIFPSTMTGTATSIFFAMQSAFSALMPLVGGMVADRWGLFEVFYLIAGVMLFSNLMIFLIPRNISRAAES